MNILFNPAFMLKPNDGSVLLMDKESVRLISGGDEGFISFIHPIHAIILNFIDGDTYENCIRRITEYINIDKKYIEKFINSLLNNEERVYTKFNDVVYLFPKYTIICSDKSRNCYDPDIFLFEKLDLRLKRHTTPTDITIMINSICATNCIYCYADRRIKTDCQIPLDRLKEIIREAKGYNARSFNILGGELFLYKYWKELLIELRDNGFFPYLSTKVPISEIIVKELSIIGIKDLQVSLDSLIPEHLCEILNVNQNYLSQIKNTLVLLDKYKIKTYIHTLINIKNDKIEDIISIYEFIRSFNNILTWRIDPAESSLYVGNSFDNFKPDKNNFPELVNYLEKITDIQINYDGLKRKEEKNLSYNEKKQQFENRVVCTANLSQIFILPDGQVTTCEEFYWHPVFLVGNVIDQSLLEIWNSEKCKYLALIPQDHIDVDSPCRICDEYYECRKYSQICWRDVMKAFGTDKWYYPDIRCPKSLELEKLVRV